MTIQYSDKYTLGIDTIKFDDGSLSIFVDHIIADNQGNQIAFVDRDRRAFIKGQDQLLDISDYLSGFSGLDGTKVNDIISILWA